MRRTLSAAVALAMMLTACAQADQVVPVGPVADAELAERTLGADGGTISSRTAGLSVRFPSGALPAGTVVRMRPAPALALAPGSGTAAGARPVSLTPGDPRLRLPAIAEFDAAAGPSRAAEAWLTAVLLVGGDSARVLRDLSVDVTNQLARVRLPSLGALLPFIPEPSQYVMATLAPARAAGGFDTTGLSATAAVPVDRLGRRACGFWGVRSVDMGGSGPVRATYAWTGCERVTVEADSALMGQLGALALQFAEFSGSLSAVGHTAAGQPVPVEGALRIGGVFRSPRQTGVLAGAAGGAVTTGGSSFALSVRIETRAESRLVQLPGVVVLQNVVYVSEETKGDGTATADRKVLDIPLAIAPGGTAALLTVTRAVELAGGRTGYATASVVLELKGGCRSSCVFER